MPQNKRLGLGHAIAQAETLLEGDFLVYNGDNIFGTSLELVVQAHNQNAFDVTMLVECASRETAQKTGVVTHNDIGAVKGLLEKPDDPSSNIVTTGVYILPVEIFRHINRTGKSIRGEIELTEAINRFQNHGSEIGSRLSMAGESTSIHSKNNRAVEKLEG